MKGTNLAKNQQSYAPFGSLQSKSKKKKNNIMLPGPGAYEISLPIIHPIIQTIRKKNNNIIVKLSHIGTSSFQGEGSRFKDQLQQSNIGPGQYSPQRIVNQQKKNKNVQKFKRKYAGEEIKHLIQNREKRSPTISQVKKIQIQDYVQMPIQIKDLALKKQRQSYIQKIKGSIWSKMREQRLKDQIKKQYNLGPGQYYHSQNKFRSQSEHYPSSAFRSQSVRSFFDNIIYQTNKEQKAKIREQIKYKSSSVGPGAYDPNQKANKFNKFQFFGSTEERKLF